ncbi:MAG: NTP transferase domain-containing protein [Pseudoxanthomonas sp.]
MSAGSDSSPPAKASLNGLVLSGGASKRMGRDKALLTPAGVPQLSATFHLLSSHVDACFVSLRDEQRQEPLRAQFPGLVDGIAGIGPAAGLLAAHHAFPAAAWLVVACDLPQLDDATLAALIDARTPHQVAVAYRSAHDGLAEPLCALWEPIALARLQSQVSAGRYRLRDVLGAPDVLLLDALGNGALDNINTPDDLENLQRRMPSAQP